MLRKLIVSLLFSAIILGGRIALAELLPCEVGDLSKGYWRPIRPDCPYPGPPAEGSPWPTDPNYFPGTTALHGAPFTITGRYKTAVTICETSYPHQFRSSRCITGLAEAWGKSLQNFREIDCHSRPICGQKFIADGVNLTIQYLSPPFSFYQESHTTLVDYSYESWVWECNPQPAEPPGADYNTGPQCPLGQ